MGNAREIYPVREGVVVSVEDASLMMSEFIKRLLPVSAIAIPRLAVSVVLPTPPFPDVTTIFLPTIYLRIYGKP